jgi:GrpB-like predicted nucleotidyltransferase (UPF0157 family)
MDPLLLAAINQRVEVGAYDAEWVGRFERERQRLVGRFGKSIVGVEHFGSTAVVGMSAKPIVDMLGGVESMDIADALLEPLCEMGYDTSKEFNATLKDKRWLMLHAAGKRTHHLHLVIFGEGEWRRSLAFRDALRGDAALVLRYETLKWELAGKYSDDREAYTAGKGDFIQSEVGNGV